MLLDLLRETESNPKTLAKGQARCYTLNRLLLCNCIGPLSLTLSSVAAVLLPVGGPAHLLGLLLARCLRSFWK